MMIKRWLTAAMILIVAVTGCSSEDSGKSHAAAGSAQIRVGNMVTPLIDVSLDNKTALDDLAYPYTSDYWTVSAGNHTLHLTSASGEASIKLALSDGHSYLVAAYGSESEPTLELIDETDALAQVSEERCPVLILHLVTGAPALDGYVAGEKLIDNLAFGQHAVFDMPLGDTEIQITPANMASLVIYNNPTTGLPNLYSMVALTGTLLEPRIVITSVSSLNLLDFFTGVAETGGYYDSARDMIEKSGLAETLSGPGPITVFAPWDSSFLDVPEFDTILADPTRLADTVRYHIVPENLPIYALAQRSTLTTQQGGTLTVTQNTSEPYIQLNNTVGVYHDYRVSNGVLYEVDEVLIPPAP
jgi:hypothetical protein